MMTLRVFLLSAALLLAATLTVAVPAQAACMTVSVATVCDMDDDGLPNLVTAGANVPLAGSVNVYAYQYELWDSTYTAAGVSYSPVILPGYNAVAVDVLCYDYGSNDECDFLYAGGGLYSSSGPSQQVYLLHWAGTTSLCVTGNVLGAVNGCQPLPV